MSKAKTKKVEPVIRSTQGLRDALFDELDALRNGDSNPGRASAMSKLAVQIINSAVVEIEFQRNIQSMPTNKGLALGSPIKLGRAA